MARLPRPPYFRDKRYLPSKSLLAEIGRVALLSASIEETLHWMYWQITNLPEGVGPLITGSYGTSRLMDEIARVSKVTNIDRRKAEDISDIFSDYRPMVALRNQCIHWRWHRSGPRHRIEPPGHKIGHQPASLTLKQIRNLADDLVWIETRLEAHILSAAELAAAKKRHRKAARLYVPTPWLDRPDRQDPKP